MPAPPPWRSADQHFPLLAISLPPRVRATWTTREIQIARRRCATRTTVLQASRLPTLRANVPLGKSKLLYTHTGYCRRSPAATPDPMRLLSAMAAARPHRLRSVACCLPPQNLVATRLPCRQHRHWQNAKCLALHLPGHSSPGGSCLASHGITAPPRHPSSTEAGNPSPAGLGGRHDPPCRHSRLDRSISCCASACPHDDLLTDMPD